MFSCKNILFVDQWRASCENIFWSIDGELLVRAFWCGSLEHDWRSILRESRMGGSHGRIEFSASLRSWWRNSRNYRKTLFSSAYAGCLCIGCVYARCLCTGCIQYVGCLCIGCVYERCLCTGCVQYTGCLCTRSVQWIKSWIYFVELMTSCWRLKQVPDLHSMGSDKLLSWWIVFLVVLWMLREFLVWLL
jgi:hypothetical protein